MTPHSRKALDAGKAHPARVYDYWLGGKNHYAADRIVAERAAANAPAAALACKENRAFLGRAVRALVAAGARQFLDIGSGFPTLGNTEQAVHAVAPEASVVCVDNDPVILAHSRALLAGRERAAVLAGDARDPGAILSDPKLLERLDLGRPVVVLLAALLHFVPDAYDPAGIVAHIRDALAPGSHLILSHATYDFNIRILNNARVYNDVTVPFVPRTRAQISAMLDGFEPLEPGLVEVAHWRPDGSRPVPRHHLDVYAAVARKP
jgi:SAM-dependent methyltransferase